jgi:hypothetical protein
MRPSSKYLGISFFHLLDARGDLARGEGGDGVTEGELVLSEDGQGGGSGDAGHT